MIKVTYIDHMGSDLSVVNAARVSFKKQSDWMPKVHNGEKNVLLEKDRKLIHYLARHRHTSPFGHCFASFHVCAPVFVARQLVKHKFLRWNEVSRRYVSDEPEFFTPSMYREAATDKKQGSGGAMDKDAVKAVKNKAEQLTKGAARTYRRMMELGLCEEQARMYLPQSMMTEWYWSGSLYAFARVCQLRLDSTAQVEVQEVARQLSAHCLTLFRHSWSALMKGDN
jgi:thymidylate synthase (FAD)